MSRSTAAVKRREVIERIPGVRGGAPVIAGTGIRVLDVAIRYEIMGMSPDEIMAALPCLGLPQIHAALAYYYAHKSELDREWRAALRKIRLLRKSNPSVLESALVQVKNLHR